MLVLIRKHRLIRSAFVSCRSIRNHRLRLFFDFRWICLLVMNRLSFWNDNAMAIPFQPMLIQLFCKINQTLSFTLHASIQCTPQTLLQAVTCAFTINWNDVWMGLGHVSSVPMSKCNQCREYELDVRYSWCCTYHRTVTQLRTALSNHCSNLPT